MSPPKIKERYITCIYHSDGRMKRTKTFDSYEKADEWGRQVTNQAKNETYTVSSL